MIVVDVNIIAYRFIDGEKTDQALKAQETESQWAVPPLCRHEFLNILATSGRRGMLSSQQCTQLWRLVGPLIREMEKPVDMDSALALALQDGITGYDAQYIALANSLGVRCLTEDGELLKKYPKIAVSLKEFTSRSFT